MSTATYFAFPILQPDGRRTRGIPPILVEKDAHCPDCRRVHDIEVCPLCGSWIEIGFGLAYGGFGTYKVCAGDSDCRWFYKVHDDEDPALGFVAVRNDPHWVGGR